MDSIVVTYFDNNGVKPKRIQITKYTVQSGEKKTCLILSFKPNNFSSDDRICSLPSIRCQMAI